MGLDMYLTGHRYIKDWEHNYEDGVIPPDSPAKKVAAAVGTDMPVNSVVVDVGCWRKANQIHKWFVDNVQGGRDECQLSWVSDKKLRQLRALIDEIGSDVEKAAALLPPQSGFFFGSTDIDDWYWDDLKHTRTVIDKALKLDEEGWTIYYQSSW